MCRCRSAKTIKTQTLLLGSATGSLGDSNKSAVVSSSLFPLPETCKDWNMPRPYECVRRAWHSDTHKPSRGSNIQHIFRLVGEAHCEKIKNNREWQEKLPIVVLKCEEILYSKANSESEYLDQGTLWGRVTDAVNTIIRLEEVDEIGKFLPPCVEAALILGCVPVKSSRSQRHCNTRTYLTPQPQDPIVVPKRVDHNNAVSQRCPISEPASSSFATQDRKLTMGNVNEPNPFTGSHKRFRYGGELQSVSLESSNPLTGGLVYPLYYGTDYQPQHYPLHINDQKRHRGNSQGILIERPFTRLIPNPKNMGASNDFVPKKKHKVAEQDSTPACDLSLRLGELPSLDVYKEKLFLPNGNNCPFDLGLSWGNSTEVGSIAVPSIRNNQASFHNFMEDSHFPSQPDHPVNQLSCPKKWLDL